MSTTGIQEQPKLYNKKSSFHGRTDSDELDVFEAERYFSGYNEAHQQVYNVTTTNYAQRSMRGGRISLDVPMMRSSLPQESNYKIDVQQKKQDKKYKQPSSPGGRLASFLNSLFNQTGSKKKKKSKSTTQSMKDEDDLSPNSVRRRRRSSISHFRSSNSTSADTKSLYSSSSSGFRTPPAYAQTPIKSYKDLRSFSDHKQLLVPSHQACVKPTIGKLINHDHHHHKRNQDLHENKVVKFSDGSTKKELLKKLNDHADDGAESDSSSDLFELENYDLGFYSSGLPVYETTHMDTIKRSAPPITTGAL